MFRKTAQAVSIFAAAAFLASCAAGNNFRVMQRKAEHSPIPVRAVVTEFTDERGFKVEANAGMIMIPLVPYASYRYERYDELFKGSVSPFRQSLAANFAKRLEAADVFDTVTYAPAEAMPPRGDYDVEVRTTMKKLDGKGGRTRYGLSFLGDIFWYLGVPYYSRRWDMEMEMQLVDGYTGKAIGEPQKVAYKTGRRVYTIYGSLSKFQDLYSKSTFMWDGYIDSLWKNLEPADSATWVALPEEGKKLLASEARDATQIRQGSPPVFSLLSPTDGANVRGGTTTVRWSATSPGRLKQATVVVNNQPVDTGLSAITLSDPDGAPLSVPATDTQVSLRMGANKIDTLLIDHRGNKTTGSYTINRIPAELFPASRRALLIGGDTDSSRKSVDKLATVFTDMQLGQFESGSVTKLESAKLAEAEILSAITKFGAGLRSGELAVVYIAGEGKAESLGIAGGSLTLDRLVSAVKSSLPTDEVIFIVDMDWKGDGGSDSISERVSGVPSRWAFVTATEQATATQQKGGMTAFADALAGVMEGRSGKEARLSLERLLDDTSSALSSSGQTPGVSGRFNTSITMVNRE